MLYHSAAGKTLSLRGAQGVATACSKRYLKSLPVLSRAATPSTLLLGRVQSRSTRYPAVRAPLTASQRARAL